jgi:ABC-type thiamine transport system substrate-binding protein
MWLSRKKCTTVNLKKVKRIVVYQNTKRITFDMGKNAIHYDFETLEKRDKYYNDLLKLLNSITIDESDTITL